MKNSVEKLDKFQDKVRKFIMDEAEKDGLELVHGDTLLLFMVEDGAYAATSAKTKPLSDFWDDAKPTDLFSMYDLATAIQTQYKRPVLQMVLTLIGRKMEEMGEEVWGKMLEVLKQITDESDGEGKMLANELNKLAEAESEDNMEGYKKAVLNILTLLR